jgi:hypothetical protein
MPSVIRRQMDAARRFPAAPVVVGKSATTNINAAFLMLPGAQTTTKSVGRGRITAINPSTAVLAAVASNVMKTDNVSRLEALSRKIPRAIAGRQSTKDALETVIQADICRQLSCDLHPTTRVLTAQIPALDVQALRLVFSELIMKSQRLGPRYKTSTLRTVFRYWQIT